MSNTESWESILAGSTKTSLWRLFGLRVYGVIALLSGLVISALVYRYAIGADASTAPVVDNRFRRIVLPDSFLAARRAGDLGLCTGLAKHQFPDHIVKLNPHCQNGELKIRCRPSTCGKYVDSVFKSIGAENNLRLEVTITSYNKK